MSTCDCEFCGVVFQPHTVFDCLRNVIFRVKELESKLGAAPVIGSKAQASEATARRQEAGAAPSVSAGVWKTEAGFRRQVNSPMAARACDLAAAVMEWYETPGTGDEDLRYIVYKFVRGEPLPEKRNG